MIYEGKDDLAELGVVQKKIEKHNEVDLLNVFLEKRFFEREDESSKGNSQIKLIRGGNYEKSGDVCFVSNHGPLTDINVQFGDKRRQVGLDHYFSDDYRVIRDEIIETAVVQDFIADDQPEN